jgi:hypothetical protein
MFGDIVFHSAADADGYENAEKKTRKMEAARRKALDRRERCHDMVDDLERRMEMGADDRWTPGCKEWEETVLLVHERKYRRALDRLQALVVARILQLAKANMVETGKCCGSTNTDRLTW